MEQNTEKLELDGSQESMNNKDYSHNDMVKIENTPFTIVTGEKGSFTAMGKYRLSEEMTYEEALEDVKRTDWDRTMQVIGIMIEEYKTK